MFSTWTMEEANGMGRISIVEGLMIEFHAFFLW